MRRLEPEKAEKIRRRRPTPAMLFRLSEHSSPAEEEASPHQRATADGHHKSKRANPCAYTPPSLKGAPIPQDTPTPGGDSAPPRWATPTQTGDLGPLEKRHRPVLAWGRLQGQASDLAQAVQRIAESHLQSLSNLGGCSEEDDELGELRELGYPREDDEDEDEDDEEDEEEDSQAEVLKICRASAGQKTTCGQGLEGPWERPPPLDEPPRDGSSEDQAGNQALREPGDEPQPPTHPEPGT